MTRAGMIWVLLGIIVLLVLAYFAFGGMRETQEAAQQTATSTTEAIDSASVRAQAATELAALRARAEAGETYEDLSAEFAQVRSRAASAYENAEGETRAEWQELSRDLDTFEAQARAGTGNFLDSLSNLIARFSADVRVETEAEE